MHIKHIILDGFKSYSSETVIGPFDEHFNAITGLNGTGKSNILDSICFVLGVSSLSTVRATKLEDLINKQKIRDDQVNSAKVAIVLDNWDKTPGICPIGYEYRDEIVVSRTIEHRKGQKEIVSKYHLNGTISQKNIIVDLFESVRLDVNNPNFMIMQGKITKVVSMKPKELLQMIEETVGATLYQHKKDKCMHVLEQYTRQKNMLDSTMNDTILPAYELQKIAAKDVEEYNKLDSIVLELETKYAVANYLYKRKRFLLVESELEKLKLAEEADSAAIEIQRECIKKLKERQKEHKQESDKQINIQAVEKEMSSLSRKFASDEAKLQSFRTNKKESADKLRKAKADYKEEVQRIENHKLKQKSLIDEFEKCNASIEFAQKMVNQTTEKLDKITVGSIIDEDGNVINIQEQLTSVEQSIRSLKGPNDIKRKDLETEKRNIVEKEHTLKQAVTDEQIERDHHSAAAEEQRLRNLLKKINLDPTELPNLENSLFQCRQRLNDIEKDISRLYNSYSYLRFNYTQPYQGFDSSLIHGLVYELFDVIDIDLYGVALEVASGGYFAQVVVASQEVSKHLISHGRLQRRTTFLPLNQMKSRGSQNIRQADLDQKFGRNKAFSAIELVSFQPCYQDLMQTVFGSTVICADTATAKVVAYQMHRRAVTLDGDIVDPGGTMQGGTRKNAGELIKACQALKALKTEKTKFEGDVHHMKQKKETCQRNSEIIHAHEAASRRLQQCADLLALTTRQTLMQELKTLKKAYAELDASIKKADGELAELCKQEKALKHKVKMENQLREKSKRETQAELKKWTRELDLFQKQKQAKNKLYNDIKIDLQAKDALLKGFQNDIDDAKVNDEECGTLLNRKEAEFIEISEEYDSRVRDLESKIQSKKDFERKVEQIGEEINAADQKIHKCDLAKLKRSSKLKQTGEKCNDLRNYIDLFVANYPNIEFRDDMQPLSTRSAEDLKKQLDHLKNNQENMRARLNFRAAEALPRTHKEVSLYNEEIKMISRRRIYLEEILDKLDMTKMHVVENAYKRINKEFDFMMNTLLPESHAELVPVNPNNIADGVTIRVRLGGVWKESLTELSGGQRSLVALSLVLSLCLYNPAPFYVLDEIDSALDLNHTSNIGYLIRTKFPRVQFICVSLKDGMYNNANVIFTTYFENGTSKVKMSMKSSKMKNASSANTSRS